MFELFFSNRDKSCEPEISCADFEKKYFFFDFSLFFKKNIFFSSFYFF